MIETLYIESNLQHHALVKSIMCRFPHARIIYCERYGEVFNPRAQNFRIQKQRPALILAEKFQKFVLQTPEGYGVGGSCNYYFSHMLNCLYDCRYCFLQGMYQSANYVLFVNYEAFHQQIQQICRRSTNQDVYFFSGYDCDSLAFEPVTGFCEYFLPVFAELGNAWLELRTKSTQIRSLLNRPAQPRCIVAFSLSPEQIAGKLEVKVPSVAKRIEAAAKLQQHGWPVGLRFDPLIFQHNFREVYQELFERVFAIIDPHCLHSVTLGVFRLPEQHYKKIHKLYPDEKLFASPLQQTAGMVSYRSDLENMMMEECRSLLLRYIPESKFFPNRI